MLLRNRERNEDLLALDREIVKYRPYLSLTPDEALARARTAPPGEKILRETLAGCSWGPLRMYGRLSIQEQADLRAGQELTFPLVRCRQPRLRHGEKRRGPEADE